MNASSIRVLLVEDNLADADLLRRALMKASVPFEVRHVTRMSQATTALQSETFNAVLTDLSLPDSQGLATVAALRQQAATTPIVVMTSLASDKTALASLDAGAQDYLVKDAATPEAIEKAIRYAIQRQQNAQMRRLLGKLRAGRRLLERKNRRLKRLYRTAHRFVDNVSHEFRTPLTVINEYVSLLRDGLVGELTSEQCRMLDIMGDRTDDLSNMVDDMLDVSRLEAGLLAVCRSPCQVRDIFSHVRPGLDRKAQVRDVKLTIAVAEDLPPVYCDAEKAGRTIVNLTINAIKFSRAGGHVKLWARSDDGGGQITIGVTDDGPGIEPDALERIFKRFQQLNTHVRSSTKGFGLGLNIARELVDLNFGTISVTSELDKGSMFSFTLPTADPVVVMGLYLERLAKGAGDLPLTLALIEADESAAGNELHGLLNLVLRRRELLLRLGRTRWLLAGPVPSGEVAAWIDRLQAKRESLNRNRPQGPLAPLNVHVLGTWTTPQQSAEVLRRIEAVCEPHGTPVNH